ncbi:ABC transporter substrate-binding protein [Alicyclobacillus macrosporangiidus]|uniref:ABC transporter substrate-binding protein n=1 Tax=Alicyclobacillus macrosporangiidus TaxID=392015 RepID=UPI00068DE3A0|nr:ABC transporter substrate-binding protein [Alicyclobacillus macrosporangiidus]
MKRWVKQTAVFLVLSLVPFGLSACGNTASTASGGTGTGGSGGGGSVEVNIGFTGPLSGGAAFYGKDVLNGITLAVNEINASGEITVGGKKVTFKVDALDDKYLPNEAATNAKRLAQQDHAPIVFCPHSGGILAIQGFNAKEQPQFILAAYSSEPAILQQKNGLTVMIPPRYDAYFEPFAKTEMEKFGKRLGLIPTTTAYGKEWAKGFSETWQKLGGTVLTNNGVDYNTTTDFSSVVSKALSEHPDVLFVGGPSQPTALVIKAARDQGFKGGFVVMDQAKFESMSGIVTQDMLNGAVGVMPLEKYPGPGTSQFIQAFKQAYGQDKVPNSENALNYQAMWAFAEAIKLAGTTTDVKAIMAKMPDAVKAVPAQKQPYGLSGISSAGHLQGPVVAAYVDHGQYNTLDIPSLDG